MSDLNKLADALENIAHMEYPSGHHDGNNLREAAALLRTAAGVDVAGLMATIDAHGLANYQEGLDDKSGKGADATDVTIKRGEIESALRMALAAREGWQPLPSPPMEAD